MKVLDLFSGIGGFSLGLEQAGMTTVAFCEKDKFCRQVLAKHWPDITIHEDVRDLDGKEYANSIDVVCGGFPCQPFSIAGKQAGQKDDRHLWPEMLRVIKESNPTWVIGENVSGFIRMALDDVCLDLESAGYEVQPFVLPACAVDARHRRDRVWIIARSLADTHGSWELQQKRREQKERGWTRYSREIVGNPTDHGRNGRPTPTEQGWSEDIEDQSRSNIRSESSGSSEAMANPDSGLSHESFEEIRSRRDAASSRSQDVAYAIGEGLQGREVSRDAEEERPTAIEHSAGFGDLSREHRGFTQDWPTEPDVGRVAHGIPNRVDRIKSLGNAVVPPLVAQIGRLIMNQPT
jgi:DNA (cytosine-5)-methyltransferase 1